MRVKFRAWNTQKNVMHTSKNSYVRFDGNVHIHVKDPWNDAVDDKYIVLMQYTGLKDKNGVEIYEQTIANICTNGGDINAVCRWNDEKFRFEWYAGKYAVYGLDQVEAEIIGNIHQNPELLEQ